MPASTARTSCDSEVALAWRTQATSGPHVATYMEKRDQHRLIVPELCRSGGIQGGLANGELIVAKIAFKPTSTIARKQNTVSRSGESVELVARGRHDPCVVPRAVPMVEAMAALVLADQLLQVTLALVALPGSWLC